MTPKLNILVLNFKYLFRVRLAFHVKLLFFSYY